MQTLHMYQYLLYKIHVGIDIWLFILYIIRALAALDTITNDIDERTTNNNKYSQSEHSQSIYWI